MDRDDDLPDDLIDLGTATVETKGQPGFQLEAGIVARPRGIADD